MAEQFESDNDVAAALDGLLGMEPAPEPEEKVQPAMRQEPEIQPQEAPEAAQPRDGVTASTEAPASADPTPAAQPAETPKPQPETSQEVQQRLSEAAQAKQEAAAARDQYLSRLNAVVPQLEMAVAGEFADLKTPEDVFRLMQTDPSRYNSFVIANTRLTQARQAQAQAHNDAQAAFITQEQSRLAKAIPEFADPEKGPELKAKLRAYAKTLKIPEDRMARSADDVLLLHTMMTKDEKLQALEKAEADRTAQLEEAKKKAAGAPKVQTPGTQRDTSGNEKAQTDYLRFQKSGRQDDLAAYLQHII